MYTQLNKKKALKKLLLKVVDVTSSGRILNLTLATSCTNERVIVA